MSGCSVDIFQRKTGKCFTWFLEQTIGQVSIHSLPQTTTATCMGSTNEITGEAVNGQFLKMCQKSSPLACIICLGFHSWSTSCLLRWPQHPWTEEARPCRSWLYLGFVTWEDPNPELGWRCCFLYGVVDERRGPITSLLRRLHSSHFWNKLTTWVFVGYLLPNTKKIFPAKAYSQLKETG